MEYALDLDCGISSVPAGSAILLLHPSTAETDRLDSRFLNTDTDHFLVISTRTTAREVEQKLEHYEVDPRKAVILDTLSVERGYSRRQRDQVNYVSSPDDIDGILSHTRSFLDNHSGKLRVSFDSITELAYYAGEETALEAVDRLTTLLEEHDAVGMFHLSPEVHDNDVVDAFRERFNCVISLSADGSVSGTLVED